MQVYLIEVNTCPALACHGAVLEDLLPRVMEEVVQKAIDPLFPPSAGHAVAATSAAGIAERASDATSGSSTAEEGRDSSEMQVQALPAKLDGFKVLLAKLPSRRAVLDRSVSVLSPPSKPAGDVLTGAI